ncbi:hypothetical protein V1508DRAFT_398721 [Lipomyces doorenjongii]|uniref:uncharacterized protein n=1 Tax=Lipomyces doorenjongii TaxID=383834 RepID=UPI0034CF468B
MTGQCTLVKDGVDISDAIRRDLSAIKVCDFFPYNWLRDDILRRSAVNFAANLHAKGVYAIFMTALNRVKNTFELEELL